MCRSTRRQKGTPPTDEMKNPRTRKRRRRWTADVVAGSDPICGPGRSRGRALQREPGEGRAHQVAEHAQHGAPRSTSGEGSRAGFFFFFFLFFFFFGCFVRESEDRRASGCR